jgi:hypothetical protein
MFVFVCGYVFIWCGVCNVFTYMFDGVCFINFLMVIINFAATIVSSNKTPILPIYVWN